MGGVRVVAFGEPRAALTKVRLFTEKMVHTMDPVLYKISTAVSESVPGHAWQELTRKSVRRGRVISWNSYGRH